MSEIDKPENQPAAGTNKPDDTAVTGTPVWPSPTGPGEQERAAWQRPAPPAESATPAESAPQTSAGPLPGGQEPASSPASSSRQSANPYPENPAPVSGAAMQSGSGAPAPGSTGADRPIWQATTDQPQGGAGQPTWQSGPDRPAQQPSWQPGAGQPAAGWQPGAGRPDAWSAAQASTDQTGHPAAQTDAWQADQPAQQPGGWQPMDPSAGYPAGGYPPGQQPWTPPAAKPRKVPTAVKVLVGGVAAISLALCSGVTGAFVATAIADRDFSLPVSTTDTAPVIDRSSLAGVAEKMKESVVSISTGSGEGSGVVLTGDGYILTNNHVIESAQGGTVTVTLSSGKKVRANVVGTDPKTDLAVVKAEADDLKPATLADSGKVAVGDTVLAIGSPLGLQGSVTSGIISAKDRTIRAGQTNTSLSGLLQTDAPINPGNSGGALVNTNGEVIGINTAIATSGGGEGNIGVGFAIPSVKAKQVAEQLIKGQKVSHPFLGVSVTPDDGGGAKIATISPNSPALAADLQVGDIITKFGDRVVNDSDDLVSAVQSGTVGQKVTVEFIRNGEKKTATVTLGEAS